MVTVWSTGASVSSLPINPKTDKLLIVKGRKRRKRKLDGIIVAAPKGIVTPSLRRRHVTMTHQRQRQRQRRKKNS
jgi:hypothetical protein